MKVTILQLDIAWGHPEENIRRAEALMAQQPDSDLYVLPEMWSTGFATEPAHIAEDESTSVSLQWMKSTARQFQCAICGSLAIKTANGVYKNRHYFVNGRTGYVSCYDKHHLFRYGGEDRFYEPGEEHTVVEYAPDVLRSAFPCLESLCRPTAVRCHHCRSQLARESSECLADSHTCQSYREPGLPDWL